MFFVVRTFSVRVLPSRDWARALLCLQLLLLQKETMFGFGVALGQCIGDFAIVGFAIGNHFVFGPSFFCMCFPHRHLSQCICVFCNCCFCSRGRSCFWVAFFTCTFPMGNGPFLILQLLVLQQETILFLLRPFSACVFPIGTWASAFVFFCNCCFCSRKPCCFWVALHLFCL